MTENAQEAENLHSDHHQGKPLILPNAWDAASAADYVAAGFHAIATSSVAMARGCLYLEAGADCVLPIMLTDDADIATYVRGVPGP